MTRELIEGQTDVLKDGTEIGVREILATQTGKVTGGDLVEFFLGANKVKFEVGDYTSDSYVAGVRINEENLPDATIKIRATEPDSNTLEIQDIRYRLNAQATRGDVYVRPGQGLRQFLDKPEGMLNPHWDIRYEGLGKTGTSTIKFAARSSDSYDLIFENREGVHYNVPLMDNSRSRASTLGWSGAKYGDSLKDFVMTEGLVSLGTTGCMNGTTITTPSTMFFDRGKCIFNVDLSDYFLLTSNPMDDTAFSHVLSYDNIDTINRQLTFNDEGTGQKKLTYSLVSQTAGNTGLLGTADLVVAGFTFKVWVQNVSAGYWDNRTQLWSSGAKNFPLAIDQDSNGQPSSTSIKIVVNGGGLLELNPKQNWATANVFIRNGTDYASTSLWLGNQVSAVNDAHVDMNLTTLSKKFDSNGVLGSGQAESINMTVRGYTDTGRTIADVDVPYPVTFTDMVSEQALANTGGVVRTVLDMVSLNEVDKLQGLTTYGVFFDLDQSIRKRNEGDILTLEYPISERGPDAYVTTGKGTVIKENVSGRSSIVHALNVGITKLASQVADVKAQNLIVVGGPCVNEVASKLMGSPADCAKDFEAGKALVKLFENDGKVAMLVAGYEAVDTQRASKWVSSEGGAKVQALTAGASEVVLLTVSPEPTVQVAAKE